MNLQHPGAPLIKQGWLRALIFIVVYAVVIFLFIFLDALQLLPARPNRYVDDSAAIAREVTMILMISFVISIVLVSAFRLFVDRKSVPSLGLTRKLPADGFVGFLMGIVLLGIATLILFFNKNIIWLDVSIDKEGLFIYAGLMLMVAVGEELVFRGYLLNNLLDSFNKWIALAITAVLFALVHGNNPNVQPVALLNLFLAGMVLGINYVYTRNLWYAILFHFIWNFFQGPVLGYKVSGIELGSLLSQEVSGSPLLTGGEFGVEGSILVSVLYIITFIVLYLIYEHRFEKSAPVV